METKFASDELVRSTSACAESYFGVGSRSGRQMRSLGETVFLRAGNSIFMQDDPAHYLFQLIDGTISTCVVMENGCRRVTGFLSERDYFGSIFSDRYRSSAETITDCTVIRMNRRNRVNGDVSNSVHGQIIVDALENELRVAQDHALLLGGVTACAKVAGFLLYLSKRAVQRGEPGNPISIPMTRYDIADFLGTTSESVSRCFTKLKQSGVIRMSTPDMITLVDRRALSDIPRGY